MAEDNAYYLKEEGGIEGGERLVRQFIWCLSPLSMSLGPHDLFPDASQPCQFNTKE